jgi:ATP-dependent RNA helicase RhlE
MAFLRDIEKLIGMKLEVTDRRTARAPAQHHRPQQNGGRPGSHPQGKQGQHQQQGRGKSRGRRNGHAGPQGGHPQRGQPQGGQPQHGQAQRGQAPRAAPAVQSSPESIATVAFMRRPERRQNTGDSNRNAR